MGKTYIDTVKYLVYTNLEIGGLVEKPDVVGAIFGQTEGLLGDELDLRELQKNGRIGRIEVELQGKGGKSVGRILLPSSLDMVETCILAAALEAVDRVGPCDAKIVVEKIEDTRNVKRKSVIDRAKRLLKTLLTNEIPESKEISELVRQEVKIAEIESYGPEKLPAGPGIRTSDSIMIVEGRADVLNLLKNDINNAVAIGGANVPKTLIGLCREKEVTVFLDGDRGGDIILKELAQQTEIDFVARAPIGREVEELSRKEIIKAIRGRVPFEQINGGKPKPATLPLDQLTEDKPSRPMQEDRPRFSRTRRPFEGRREEESFEQRGPTEQAAEGIQQMPEQASEQSSFPQAEAAMPTRVAASVPEQLLKSLDELENTLRARLYNSSAEQVNEIPVRDLIKTLGESTGVHAIVFDGIITQRLVDLAESKGTALLVGVRSGNLFRKPEGMLIHTKK
ncbi:MAG: DNA primase DnaG [Candidatus Micrarchaeota archaeon]